MDDFKETIKSLVPLIYINSKREIMMPVVVMDPNFLILLISPGIGAVILLKKSSLRYVTY